MKRFLYIFIVVLIILCSDVKASSLSFSFEKRDGELSLEVIHEDKVIDYEDAISRFNLEKYIKLKYNGKDVYFYKGKEISEKEYIIGDASEDADIRSKQSEYNIRVKNTDEFIEALKKIYDGKKNGLYELDYSVYEYENFDIDEIKEFYEDAILTDLDVNMYKFHDYGIRFPVRYMPTIGETDTSINFNNAMITDDELNKVEDFMKYFVTLFDGKSDYEKVLGVYTYIKNTTKYVEDNGYDNMIDAYLSPYDSIFKNSIVCIGASTTAQYMFEKLGIESYIVDRVEKVDKRESLFFTSHTYNVVKLDDKWFIFDITAKDGFLINKTNEYKNDTYSKKIDIYDVSYLDINKDLNKEFEFDYNAINKVIKGIIGSEKMEEVVEDKKTDVNKKDNTKKEDEETKYIILSLILVVIFLIIIIFSRKK